MQWIWFQLQNIFKKKEEENYKRNIQLCDDNTFLKVLYHTTKNQEPMIMYYMQIWIEWELYQRSQGHRIQTFNSQLQV